MRGLRAHSSTLPSAVVRVDMVQVEPLDDEPGPAHPRAGEVRFHGDRGDAEDVERGSTVDSDAPPSAEALDTTADEDRARAARPRSSSPWAFPPSAKHAGGRNAPNVLPVVSPPVKKDRRKSNTYLMIGVGLCIGVVISLLLIINCVFLARIDDGIRTGGVNTNFAALHRLQSRHNVTELTA